MAPTASGSLTGFPNANLKLWLVGTFLGAVAYGIVIVLCLGCTINYLQCKAPRRGSLDVGYRKGTSFGRFFLPYILWMFLLSTLAVVCSCIALVDVLFPPPGGAGGVTTRFVRFGGVVSLVVASWAADALVIWRCVILYEDASRALRSSIDILLCIMALISLGLGLTYLATSLTDLNKFMLIFVLATSICNFIMTTLIVLRLWYHRRFIQEALGREYGSPYARVIAICVESAALIVVFNLAHVCAHFNSNIGLVLSHQLLVHVYGISALLILYRVLDGRIRGGEITSDETKHNTQHTRFSLHFSTRSSSTCARNDDDYSP
ncbi:unnamed protein product [Cyclocybe aegerita]|uniref:Uncharacterized protein n=1 Tax=Cyclocybe aegerita TaxID=1973307 RepID=A0A8S0VSD8_CYCAE|nr:unnamed protein product [Cyclocybe aegerita]